MEVTVVKRVALFKVTLLTIVRARTEDLVVDLIDNLEYRYNQIEELASFYSQIISIGTRGGFL